MKANFSHRGESLDYTNATGAKIDAGDILVVGDLVGVAGTDIPDGDTGSVTVAGVFEMPKTGTNAITLGSKVYFDGTGITDTASSNSLAGYAAQAAASGDTTCFVKLLG